MKTLTLILLCRVVLAQSQVAAERHEFVIANFRTEGGVVLPQARIVYGTYGHLREARPVEGLRCVTGR